MLSKILYILLALVILMVLITVHEFGHYLAGKLFKFKINEFSIGFGKAIYKKTRKDGEVFSVRILPLGGFCAFEGEDEENPSKDAFNNKPAWQRLIVLFSGVFFNFMFGVLMSAIYLMVAGYAVPMVGASKNPALMQGDVIVAVNNVKIEAYRPAADLLQDYANQDTIKLTIERDGQTIEVEVNKINSENGYFYVYDESKIKDNLYVLEGSSHNAYSIQDFKNYVINANVEVVASGEDSITQPVFDKTFYRLVETKDPDTGAVISSTYEEYKISNMIEDKTIVLGGKGKSLGIVYGQIAKDYGFFESLLKAWPFAFYICGVILGALGGLFTGATRLADMGGTITTISTIAEVSAISPIAILYLFPMLSLNLAVFNILPIPALDGARMCFVAWEGITKKPVNRKVEGWIHTIGLFALLALVIFLDIYHFFIM